MFLKLMRSRGIFGGFAGARGGRVEVVVFFVFGG